MYLTMLVFMLQGFLILCFKRVRYVSVWQFWEQYCSSCARRREFSFSSAQPTWHKKAQVRPRLNLMHVSCKTRRPWAQFLSFLSKILFLWPRGGSLYIASSICVISLIPRIKVCYFVFRTTRIESRGCQGSCWGQHQTSYLRQIYLYPSQHPSLSFDGEICKTGAA